MQFDAQTPFICYNGVRAKFQPDSAQKLALVGTTPESARSYAVSLPRMWEEQSPEYVKVSVQVLNGDIILSLVDEMARNACSEEIRCAANENVQEIIFDCRKGMPPRGQLMLRSGESNQPSSFRIVD